MTKPSLSFETATATHTGRVREVNEDAIFANAKRGIWLVADGMGGHREGRIASSMIAEAAATIQLPAGRADALIETVKDVNTRLLNRGNGTHDSIVGSTVNALVIEGNRYSCLWAGDSRCYLVRAGEMTQVSQDHTEVQELVNAGAISKEEARTWPRRNVITRAVGVYADFALDKAEGEIAIGDCFILCSDGLTAHVTDQEILSNTSWSTARSACDRLMELALERGGKDNISIIVVRAAKPDKTQVLESQWGLTQGAQNE